MFRIVFSMVLVAAGLSQQAQNSLIYEGTASVYSDKLSGKILASGQLYDPSQLTAAHKQLAFGTKIKVTCPETQKSVVVRINDRGPFIENQIIQLSKAAALKLDFANKPTMKISFEIVNDQEDKYNINMDTLAGAESYYQILCGKAMPKGWAIQLSGFENAAGMLDYLASIDSTFRDKIMVKTQTNGQKIHYKILSGPYDTRQEAEKAKNNFTKSFPGCFIIKL